MTAHFPLCLYFVSSRLCVILESRGELAVSSWQTSTLMCKSQLPSSVTLNRFSTTVVELKTLNYKVSFQHSLDGQTTHLHAVKRIQSRKDTDMYLSNGNSGLISIQGLCVYLLVKGGDFLEWDWITAAQKDAALRQGLTTAPVKTKYIVSATTSSIWMDSINKL